MFSQIKFAKSERTGGLIARLWGKKSAPHGLIQ